MDYFDPEVEKHLLAAMEDPYFEVRAQACRTRRSFWPISGGKARYG